MIFIELSAEAYFHTIYLQNNQFELNISIIKTKKQINLLSSLIFILFIVSNLILNFYFHQSNFFKQY